MNVTSVHTFVTGRFFLILALATVATLLLSGCAAIRQYSIDSWQGPIPSHDVHYAQESGV